MADVIVIGIIIVCLGLIGAYTIKKKKSGSTGCGCSCNGCAFNSCNKNGSKYD